VTGTDKPVFVVLFGKGKPASPGSDLDAHSSALLEGHCLRFKFCIGDRLTYGTQQQWDCTWNMFPVFGRQLGFPIEIDNLSRDLYRGIGDTEAVDGSNTAGAAVQRIPIAIATVSDRRYRAHPRDHNATARAVVPIRVHKNLPSLFFEEFNDIFGLPEYQLNHNLIRGN
jgi:hypothetical protein